MDLPAAGSRRKDKEVKESKAVQYVYKPNTTGSA